MSLTQRMKQYAAIPDQLERAANGIAILMTVTGLIALIALGLSIVALERTSNAH